jgi:hypothetical protein
MPRCLICDAEFTPPRVTMKPKIYCSRKCNMIAWALREQKKITVKACNEQADNLTAQNK